MTITIYIITGVLLLLLIAKLTLWYLGIDIEVKHNVEVEVEHVEDSDS